MDQCHRPADDHLKMPPNHQRLAAQSRGFTPTGQLTFRALLKGGSQAIFRVNR